MTGATVAMRNVAFRYRDDAGVFNMRFDLDVPAGAIVAIVGPSGAGKSTLLSLIAGFDEPTAGQIVIGDVDCTGVEPSLRPVSVLFQDHNLFAHLDIRTNIALGLSPQLRLTSEESSQVDAALESVGLTALQHRLPGEISGGERQRAALARVLVRNRPVLLLDEPFAALGPALRADMLKRVAELNRETGVTIIMVTHAPEDAKAIANLTAYIDSGHVVACRPTAELFAARDLPQLTAYLG